MALEQCSGLILRPIYSKGQLFGKQELEVFMQKLFLWGIRGSKMVMTGADTVAQQLRLPAPC